MSRYKLWALKPTIENIDRMMTYPYCFACPDHILVVAKERLDGAIEITNEDKHLLSVSDWQFLYGVSNKIFAEEMAEYKAEAEAQSQAFMERFITELEAERVKINAGEQYSDN